NSRAKAPQTAHSAPVRGIHAASTPEFSRSPDFWKRWMMFTFKRAKAAPLVAIKSAWQSKPVLFSCALLRACFKIGRPSANFKTGSDDTTASTPFNRIPLGGGRPGAGRAGAPAFEHQIAVRQRNRRN